MFLNFEQEFCQRKKNNYTPKYTIFLRKKITSFLLFAYHTTSLLDEWKETEAILFCMKIEHSVRLSTGWKEEIKKIFYMNDYVWQKSFFFRERKKLSRVKCRINTTCSISFFTNNLPVFFVENNFSSIL